MPQDAHTRLTKCSLPKICHFHRGASQLFSGASETYMHSCRWRRTACATNQSVEKACSSRVDVRVRQRRAIVEASNTSLEAPLSGGTARRGLLCTFVSMSWVYEMWLLWDRAGWLMRPALDHVRREFGGRFWRRHVFCLLAARTIGQLLLVAAEVPSTAS